MKLNLSMPYGRGFILGVVKAFFELIFFILVAVRAPCET